MVTKYFNDAIIGNGTVTASFSKTGELLRLYSPTVDYKQFIERFNVGVKINDSAMIYLHNDINNAYNQEYSLNTNVLETEILNTYFNLRVCQTDFVPIKENVLIKHYKLINESNIDFDLNFLVYSEIITNLNNDTCGYFKNDALIQYNHDYSVCVFSKEVPNAVQINGVQNNIMEGVIGGKDFIGMSSNSAISYHFNIPAGKSVALSIYVYINDNNAKCMLNELDNEIERFRKIDVKKEIEDTKKYWKKFVKDHDKMGINKLNIDDRIKKVYNRSILLFPLLTNPVTGGISAGIEVDENKTKCGRYAYCWPRDGVFITEALDAIGMGEESERFYSKFCKMTQSKNGMWEQRFYTDGKLAPAWGYQIDETASVIFGAYAHYKVCRDKNFLKSNLKMLENATIYLEKYIEDLLNQTGKFEPSYDLWEEFEGVSLYSISAIFAAFSAMLKIYEVVKDLFENNRLKIEAINKQIKKLEILVLNIKGYCLKEFYDDNKKSYVRNTVDKKIDISMLGTVVPFNMFTPKEKNIQNTIERINMTIRTYTGGYIRYEDDCYMGGYNPWPIANLWMACYNLEAGENKKALENFSFVTTSASDYGLLGEQVNNDARKPAWVIGLTWSHAMYIIVLQKLKKQGLI
jgi:oligosaccharide amylase